VSRAARLRAYFLGVLPEPEREVLEEEVLAEKDLHEEMQASADDLAREYLYGRLSGADRARFEAHFLASPRRRARVAFLRDLAQAVEGVGGVPAAATGPARLWTARPLAWAAALLIGLVVLLVLLRRPAGAPGLAHQEPPVPAPTAGPEATAAARALPTRTQTVRLAPDAGGTAPTSVSVDSGVAALRLRVPLPEPVQPGYDVQVRDAAGTVRWRSGDVAPASAAALEVEVPAAALPAGDYEVVVQGATQRDASPAPGAALHVRFTLVRRP